MLQTLDTTTPRFDTPQQRKHRVTLDLDEDGLPIDRLQMLVTEILPRRGGLVRFLWLHDAPERGDRVSSVNTRFMDVLESVSALRYLNLVIRNESFGDKTLIVPCPRRQPLTQADAAGQAHFDRGARHRNLAAKRARR